MTLTKTHFELFERQPKLREQYVFLTSFYHYWHDQNLFISKLKELEIDRTELREYYRTLKGHIEQNREFIKYWCKATGPLHPNSYLYEEIKELQRIINSIIFK